MERQFVPYTARDCFRDPTRHCGRTAGLATVSASAEAPEAVEAEGLHPADRDGDLRSRIRPERVQLICFQVVHA